ncbi:MAG: amidohydrolase family protein [Paludibacteraceae bacterium]|nr:amidohydrolase family protein [Paludibacteraceae bacterium]
MKKLFLALIAIAAIAAIALTGCKDRIDEPQPRPIPAKDMVVYGDIYTAEVDNDGNYVMAEALVVKGGKFVYVGTVDSAKTYITDGIEVIDRRSEKGLIIPGITDGHAHYLLKYINQQMKENALQFEEDQNYELVLKKVRDFVNTAKNNGRHLDYVYGEGYNPLMLRDSMGKDLRHRKDLDAITTEIPIFLTGYDHHSTLVNTRAMINAGIVDEKGNVLRDKIAGGFISLDDQGKMTGVFSERAMSLLQGPGLKNKMHPTSAQVIQGIDSMQKSLLALGITNIIEGWANNYGVDDESMFQTLKSMDSRNVLYMNVSLTYEIEPWFNNNEPACYVNNAASVQKRYQSKHVHPDYLKLFMDGCVEMGTGFLLTPYNQNTKDSIFSGHGTALWSQDAMDNLVMKANEKGLTVHTHAMGDGAVRRTIEAYKKGNPERRNAIVHLRNVDPADYQAIKDYNIAVSSNMNWHCLTQDEEKHLKDILPYPYYEKAYPIQSFFKHGILVSQCTDTPADNGIRDPFYCMMVAITGAYEPSSYISDKDEIIDRYQFLQAATYNGAWQLHLENERGSIKSGKYADFVILDQNVLTCDAQMLRNTQVIKTFFEGKEVYSR